MARLPVYIFRKASEQQRKAHLPQVCLLYEEPSVSRMSLSANKVILGLLLAVTVLFVGVVIGKIFPDGIEAYTGADRVEAQKAYDSYTQLRGSLNKVSAPFVLSIHVESVEDGSCSVDLPLPGEPKRVRLTERTIFALPINGITMDCFAKEFSY